MPQVQCSECGFLTRLVKGEYIEVCEADRRSLSGVSAYPFPMCLQRQPLTQEVTAIPRIPSDGFMQMDGFDLAAMTNVINKPRDCDRFRQWEPGLTPREHKDMDMIERQAARDDQRDREQRRMHIIELAIVGFAVPIAMIGAQVVTTRMQVAATIQAAHEAQAILQPPAVNITIDPTHLPSSTPAATAPKPLAPIPDPTY